MDRLPPRRPELPICAYKETKNGTLNLIKDMMGTLLGKDLFVFGRWDVLSFHLIMEQFMAFSHAIDFKTNLL